jgi:hypothetical protein
LGGLIKQGAAVVALIVGGLLSACSARSGSQAGSPAAVPSTDPTSKALAEFARQVDEYARLRRSAARSLAPFRRGLDATEVWAREERLADTIRALRARAQRGDLFTASVTPVLVEIVQGFLGSPEGAAARESIADANPVKETPQTPVVLAVNGTYAHGASLATMPSALLMRLPYLPAEVEFRFVGRHLVLRDRSADIILDYILDVAP